MDNIPLAEPGKGRKRVKIKGTSKKDTAKAQRYEPKSLPVKPKCKHNKKSYRCDILTSNDIFYFHKQFYEQKNKIDQDNFIIKFTSSHNTKRRRPKNGSRNPKSFAMKYFIRKYRSSKLIPVCRQAFIAILRIGVNRLKGVLMRFNTTGIMASERRGGDQKKFEFAARREAVINFIRKFRSLESHYCRGKNVKRYYLDPSLNITKMHTMYNDNAQPGFGVTRSFFRKIFTIHFNIGFGTPRQDVCSTCLQFTEKMLKQKKTDEKRNILIIEQRIHKLRAKCFFKILRDRREDLLTISYDCQKNLPLPRIPDQMLRDRREDLLTISYDCQKNLPLPRIPDQATYYSRQLYLFNFTVVIGSSNAQLTTDNVESYLWTEDVASKSSNEIASGVYHCLTNLQRKGKLDEISTVRLMADGCAGQNKNSIITGMCIKFFSTTPKTVKKMELVFPVTGHSFLPADRIFALTEKEIRRHEIIEKPEDYVNIIRKHASTFQIGTEIPVSDWRTASREALKDTAQWHFQISKVKRIVLKRAKTTGTILVRGELSYNSDTGTAKSLFRKNKNANSINPDIIPPGVAVAREKLKDVQSLLEKHYGEEWKQFPNLEYYKEVLDRPAMPSRNDETCEGHRMEEVSIV